MRDPTRVRHRDLSCWFFGSPWEPAVPGTRLAGAPVLAPVRAYQALQARDARLDDLHALGIAPAERLRDQDREPIPLRVEDAVPLHGGDPGRPVEPLGRRPMTSAISGRAGAAGRTPGRPPPARAAPPWPRSGRPAPCASSAAR